MVSALMSCQHQADQLQQLSRVCFVLARTRECSEFALLLAGLSAMRRSNWSSSLLVLRSLQTEASDCLPVAHLA
jgi:hypothetical protein